MLTKYIIFLTLSIVIWIVLVLFFCPKLSLPSKFESIDSILKVVDNGDILLLSGNSFPEKAIRLYTWSCFSHIAFIFRDWNKNKTKRIPYIWEADVGGKYKAGPRVMKLKTKLKYPGKTREKVCVISTLNSQRPDTAHILSVIDRNVAKGMDHNMISWVFSGYPNSYIFKQLHNESNVFCSELIAQTLMDLNLLGNLNPACYFSPKTIKNLEMYNKDDIFVKLF